MFIIGDTLMFITTSLVFSITCLCVLLQVKARDRLTKNFLLVLIPLCLQMCLMILLTYIQRVYSDDLLGKASYKIFALWITFTSILLTTVLLLMLSRFLVGLLPASDRQVRIGHLIIHGITIVFLFLSLFLIIAKSNGNWPTAMFLTTRYHFFAGSMLMIAHGITSLFYIKKATSWEHESLLKGIAIAFLPLVGTFPVDIIFFQEHVFKLAYLAFMVLVVYLYFFINRHYFRNYEFAKPADVSKSKKLHELLSPRELEIVKLLVEGKTNNEIGQLLFISPNTVKTHVKNLYEKLKVSNRIQLYAKLTDFSNNHSDR
ncbi:MAG: helix-turn-helix transcriptional regulator [Sphaerochaetaceae bacterium]|nr:helix-turn-helix transcriptional regulator [Sphaerochaetaceae bacterium]NLV84492.1 helix-turn-helix transcriptional regulator [Spirochaetales bacterium]